MGFDENSDRPLKLFAESVPQLKASSLLRSRAGRVGFRIEGRGLLIVAEVAIFDQGIQVDLYREVRPEKGGIPEVFDLPMRSAKGGVKGMRTFFECLNCERATDVIYLHRNSWACRNCHGLFYRSQYMPIDQKLATEYEELCTAIRQGRLRYERHSTWERKLQRIEELRSMDIGGRTLRKDQSRLTYVTIYDLPDHASIGDDQVDIDDAPRTRAVLVSRSRV